MITYMTIVIAVLVIGMAARVVFRDYPASAISLARNQLFSLRDELFDLGRKGDLDFKSPGYKAARLLINGMIRYAHDLSLTQLLCTFAIKIIRRQKLPPSEWDRAISMLPEDQRKCINQVLGQAFVTMFRLLVTRSVLLSAALLAFMIVRALGLCLAKIRDYAVASRPEPHVNHVEEVYEDVVLHQRSGRSFQRAVTAEAKRYSLMPDMRQLQAA